MLDILSVIPGKHKQTSSGWVSFNAVCCQHNGERADKRKRGGIKPDGENWSYHCFNCGYKASFKLGRTLSFQTRKLLAWMGVDQNTISTLNLESLRHKDISQLAEDRTPTKLTKVTFDTLELPKELRLIEESDQPYVEYLESRAVDPGDYPYMISPDQKGRQAERIVIPYTYDGVIVGWSARYLDDRQPKFINEQQQGYVFGTDLQQAHWTQAIVVEGIFDALSILVLACMHETISKEQAQLLKQLKRRIIVVPDQDRAGLSIIDAAVEHKFEVSIPEWPEDVKDVNDAVVKYGVVTTLLHIHNNAETSKIKIEMFKKRLQRKLSE